MAHSYPVWVQINSCAYKQPKSYGIKKHSEQSIFVGTSASNSHHFADIKIKHEIDGLGQRRFTLYVDGVIVKQGVLYSKTGKGKLDTFKNFTAITKDLITREEK